MSLITVTIVYVFNVVCSNLVWSDYKLLIREYKFERKKIQDIRYGCELCKKIDTLVCTNMSSNVVVALIGVIS